MAMKAYKSYKNVDLPWLKRVPEHWEIATVNTLFFNNEEKNEKCTVTAAYQFKFGKIVKKPNFELTNDLIETYKNYALVRPNDIMINGLNLNYDFVTQRVGIVQEPGIITSSYISIRPYIHTNAKLYTYLFKAWDAQKVFNGMGTGIRRTLSWKELKQVTIPVPPKEEQDQIVRYLDWQNSRLNKLINAKKKEIALLEEQKQALISQAVTKGLDPHAPLKDSGIDWIGQIPEHWQINKMNRLFNLIGSGTTPSSGSIDFYNNGNIPWLNSGDLYGDKPVIKKTAKHITELALNSFSTLKLYNADSIAIAMYGASVGNISIVPFEFCCNQACCVFSKPIKNLSLKYVYYNVIAGKKDLIEQAKGGGQPNINQDILRQFRLPFPPLHEQEHIVDYLTDQCAIIDDLIANINKTISFLQEYRTRLVADVVTGQIDVRNIAIPNYETVPETIDQPETAEESAISAEDQ